MSLLDALFGIRKILSAGVELIDARALNFGAGLSAVYNSIDKRIDVSGSAGAAGWFVPRTATGNFTAVAHDFVQVTPASTPVVVTAPAAGSGVYFGVQLCGQALGKSVEIRKPDTTLIYTLDVDDESVWLVYDNAGATWRVVAARHNDPDFTTRFSALGNWLNTGVDANLTDSSGNARDMTKGGTVSPAMGYGARLASGYLSLFSRTDAALRLSGAMSYEVLVCPIITSIASGYLLQCGTGSGSTQNLLYALRMDSSAIGQRWLHRQQNGTNSNSDLLGPQATGSWDHIAVTRASDNVTTKMYVNGLLSASGTLVAATGGASGDARLCGTVSNQPTVALQHAAIYGAELTAAQVAYLAKLRMAKRTTK